MVKIVLVVDCTDVVPDKTKDKNLHPDVSIGQKSPTEAQGINVSARWRQNNPSTELDAK